MSRHATQQVVTRILALSVLLGATGRLASAQPCEHLILWNKLGSDEEVLNSAYGPNLEFYSDGGGLDVPGNRTYVSGVFDGAVTLDEGPYFMLARVHNIVLHDLGNYISAEQGTVELWYQQVADPVAYLHNPYRVFGGSFGLNSGMTFESQGDDPYGPRFRFGLQFGGTWVEVHSVDDAYRGYNISPYNQTWIHLAGVWDRNGIDGSADTMRLYLDDEVVATATDNSWGSTVGSQVDICGGNDAEIAFKFYMDNLTIWDYAKTDFSDRFTEEPCEEIPGYLDIKPGSCPNPFSRKSRGVLPVAVLGSMDFDVTTIDVSTVRLARADHVGGEVAPLEGPPGPHSVVEDVATPFEGELCDCHDLGADGYLDLSMKFSSRDVVAALELEDVPGGTELELVVSGSLLDEPAFAAHDCIVLRPNR